MNGLDERLFGKPKRPGCDRLLTEVAAAFLLLFLLAPGPALAQVPQGWDVNTPDTLLYRIYVDMANDSTQFTEFDTVTLAVIIEDGTVRFTYASTFYDTTSSWGPFFFQEDGTIAPIPPDSLAPPMEAELLLHVFAPPPLNASATAWSTLDPPDSVIALEDGKISLQQQSQFELTGTRVVDGDTLKDFSLQGYLRLADNSFMRFLIGPDSSRPPEIHQIMADLGQFNLFLVGSLSWNINRRATEVVEATYVAIPHSGSTPSSILTDWRRRHLTATMEVLP